MSRPGPRPVPPSRRSPEPTEPTGPTVPPVPTLPDDDLVEEISLLARALFREGTAVASAIGRAAGLHATDIHALRVLDAAAHHPTMGELADTVGLSSAAVTGLVDRLEHAGLASRVLDPADRRRVRVTATPAARELAMTHLAPLMHRIDRAVAELDPADRPAVAAFLRRLAGRSADTSGGSVADSQP